MASGFDIDGMLYEVPAFDSFTLDEAQVLYDYSGLAIEDFVSADPDASDEEKEAHEQRIIDKAKNPAFKRALLHIAYQRGNPEMKAVRVKEVVGKANLLDVSLGLAGEEDEASPPDQAVTARTPTPPSDDDSSASVMPASDTSSGSSDSAVTSAGPDAQLATTGATS